MKKLFVCCKENGDFIEEVENVKEGLELIKKYEEQDRKDGIYEEDFYDIENEEHITIK